MGNLRTALIVQDPALQQDREYHRHTKKPDGQQRGAPAYRRHEKRRDRRTGGKAQVAAERVQREGTPDALLVDRAGQDGIVRWMNHRVADARQRRQHQDLPEGCGQSHRGDRQRHQQRATDQEPPRAVAVDEEADWGLQDGRGAGHQCDRQPELGEAHVECVLPDHEHRRQAKYIEVREEMAVANENIDTGVAA